MSSRQDRAKGAVESDVINECGVEDIRKTMKELNQDWLQCNAEEERTERIALLCSFLRVNPDEFRFTIRGVERDSKLAEAAITKIEPRKELRKVDDEALTNCIAADAVECIFCVILPDHEVAVCQRISNACSVSYCFDTIFGSNAKLERKEKGGNAG